MSDAFREYLRVKSGQPRREPRTESGYFDTAPGDENEPATIREYDWQEYRSRLVALEARNEEQKDQIAALQKIVDQLCNYILGGVPADQQRKDDHEESRP